MPKPFEKLSSEVGYKNRFWQSRHDEYILSDGKTKGDYYYLDLPGAVNIIPITNDGKIVLTKQYRYLFDKEVIEFCGGGVKSGQDPLDAAKNELEEELGYLAKNWIFVGRFMPCNGINNEYAYVFIAKDLTKVETKQELTESIKPLELTFEELRSLINDDKIECGEALASLMMARKYLNFEI